MRPSNPISPWKMTLLLIFRNGCGRSAPFCTILIVPPCSTTNKRPLPSLGCSRSSGVAQTGDHKLKADRNREEGSRAGVLNASTSSSQKTNCQDRQSKLARFTLSFSHNNRPCCSVVRTISCRAVLHSSGSGQLGIPAIFIRFSALLLRPNCF